MPSLEICFVSYDSGEALRSAIRSIGQMVPGVDVAIVEHGTDPLDPSTLVDAPVSVRVEHDPSNPGFAAGCNRLAAGSDARWLLFLNPDVVVRAWPGVDALDPGAVYGPHHRSARATGAHSGKTFSIWDEIQRSWLRRQPTLPDGVGFVSGAALLLERAVYASLGGFDESYFMYYEDIDLCLRANDAGYETRLLDGWLVEHEGGHAAGRDLRRALERSYVSGSRFHASRGESLRGYRAYVAVDATLRAIVAAVRRDHRRTNAYRGLAARAGREALARRSAGGAVRTDSDRPAS